MIKVVKIEITAWIIYIFILIHINVYFWCKPGMLHFTCNLGDKSLGSVGPQWMEKLSLSSFIAAAFPYKFIE
jgi:hypothetical protein